MIRMINQLLKTEKEVRKILEEYPITRTDDNLLFIAYWMKKAPEVSFIDFWKSPQLYGAVAYKSVERCRRKVQSKHPELKEKVTAEAREQAEMDYINYAIGG